MYDLNTFAVLAIVLSLGIFIQSASGFAAGMLIISGLLWMGYPIPEAQVALLIATLPQNIWGVWSLRDAIDSRSLVWPAVGRLVFLPPGIATLWWLDGFPSERIKQVVGAVLLVVTISLIMLRVQPRRSLHPLWACLAFPSSGFLQGLIGIGGPSMVLWVQAHDWDTRRSRGFLFAMYLVSLPPALLLLGWTFGLRVGPVAVMSVALIPLQLLVTRQGLRLGTRLGRRRLRRVTLGLLVVMALLSLAAPWIG